MRNKNGIRAIGTTPPKLVSAVSLALALGDAPYAFAATRTVRYVRKLVAAARVQPEALSWNS